MRVPKCCWLAILAATVGFAAAPYPPPGKLVDAGGYRVHLYCVGKGSPTVVIVGTEFSFDWALVQPEAAKFTRVCTYDASGTAWSDPGPKLTCIARIAELHTVLKNAAVEGPYVLVGLSMGAVVARLYASQYPAETAAMVIVDHAFLDAGAPSHPDPAPASGRPPAGLDSSRADYLDYRGRSELQQIAAAGSRTTPLGRISPSGAPYGGSSRGMYRGRWRSFTGQHAAGGHQHSQSSAKLRQAADGASGAIQQQ